MADTAGDAEGRHLARQILGLAGHLQTLQGGDHLAATGPRRSAGVGTEFTPSREPGGDNGGQDAQHGALESHEDLGDHYVRQGNLMLAYLQYDKALRFNPDNWLLRYKIGMLFVKRGLPDEARKEFLEVLKVSPDHVPTLLGLGHSYLLTGDFVPAEEYFRKVLEIDGRNWSAHNFLGVIYNRQGKYDDAIRGFENAAKTRAQTFVIVREYYFNRHDSQL